MHLFPLLLNIVGLLAAVAVTVAAVSSGNRPLVMMAATVVVWELVLVLDGTLVPAVYDRAVSMAAEPGSMVFVITNNTTGVSGVRGYPQFWVMCETLAFIYKMISNVAFAANACLAIELFQMLSPFSTKHGWWSYLRNRTSVYLCITFALPTVLNLMQTLSRASDARYVRDSYCDYDRYVYQFVVYEIIWDVLFFTVGICFLMNATIAYYRKHRNLSGTREFDFLEPANPAALRAIVQFVFRMIVWCCGISVLALAYFVNSIRTAASLAGTVGLNGPVGVSSDSVDMNLYIPGVGACLMLACFGSTQRALSTYSRMISCFSSSSRKKQDLSNPTDEMNMNNFVSAPSVPAASFPPAPAADPLAALGKPPAADTVSRSSLHTRDSESLQFAR